MVHLKSIVILVIFCMVWLTYPHPSSIIEAPGKTHDSIVLARISFTGDLMCHMPQLENARVCDDSFDFAPCFAPVRSYLLDDDLTIGNFETTCSGKEQGYSGYPAFNTPDAFLRDLKGTGFDFLGMANNHAMDRGEAGLLRTLSIVRGDGLGYAGTFRSKGDRDSLRIMDIHGIHIGILNYTYGTNGAYPSKEHNYMLAVIDTGRMSEEIKEARPKGAEIIALFLHFGQEMQAEPTPFQDSIVNFAIRAGADLIIGSHPHVIGPVRFFKTVNGGLDSGLVAFSLGNFFSNQYWRYTDAGVILTVGIEKNTGTGKLSIREVNYLPTWVYRGTNPEKRVHIIFPAEQAATDTSILFLDPECRRKAKEALDDTRKMLEKNGYWKLRIIPGRQSGLRN